VLTHEEKSLLFDDISTMKSKQDQYIAALKLLGKMVKELPKKNVTDDKFY